MAPTMHHSRLSTFVIDCQSEDLERATDFWSQALGRDVKPPQADLSLIHI